MEQLIEYDEKDNYAMLEETMKVCTKQYEQLNDKKKNSRSCIK